MDQGGTPPQTSCHLAVSAGPFRHLRGVSDMECSHVPRADDRTRTGDLLLDGQAGTPSPPRRQRLDRLPFGALAVNPRFPDVRCEHDVRSTGPAQRGPPDEPGPAADQRATYGIRTRDLRPGRGGEEPAPLTRQRRRVRRDTAQRTARAPTSTWTGPNRPTFRRLELGLQPDITLGGTDGVRTRDLRIDNPALYQLSYDTRLRRVSGAPSMVN